MFVIPSMYISLGLTYPRMKRSLVAVSNPSYVSLTSARLPEDELVHREVVRVHGESKADG